MKRFSFLWLAVALVSVGCTNNSTSPKDAPFYETGTIPQTMSEKMPDDFGFSVSYGIEKKNEINSFTNTVTKDLIEDGTITAAIALTEEEKAEIYDKMKEADIRGTKNYIPNPINGTTCEQTPFEEDQWEITMNGETITHAVSGAYCEPTEDAKQLFALRNFVVSKMRSKEEYMKLPYARGGYD
ncbi:hypothetical protein ABE021_06280 [Sporosarcina gallistercoris]|uniref:hypothetical protein n=1 Tax=Sporosarcina gallistercoris TaxID=2762245 RepID=UPI003D2C961A